MLPTQQRHRRTSRQLSQVQGTAQRGADKVFAPCALVAFLLPMMLCSLYLVLTGRPALVEGTQPAYATELKETQGSNAAGSANAAGAGAQEESADAADENEDILAAPSYVYAPRIGQPSKYNAIQALARIPASAALDENLALTISFEAPENCRMIYTELGLYNSKQEQLAFKTSYREHPVAGAHSLNIELDTLKKEQQVPGAYRIKLRMVSQVGHDIKVFQENYQVLFYHASKPALPVLSIVRLSLPPFYSTTGEDKHQTDKLDEEVLKASLPRLEQLNSLLKELHANPRQRITLSIPMGSLKDFYQARESNALEQAELFHSIISELEYLSVKEQIELVYSGYNDPNLEQLLGTQSLYDLIAHYQEGSIHDNRDLPPLNIRQGSVPANLSIPKDSLHALAEAQTPWLAVLPRGLESEAQDTEPQLYHAQGHEDLKVIKASSQFKPQLETGSINELAAQLLTLYEKQEEGTAQGDTQNPSFFAGIYPLTGNENSYKALIEFLTYSAQESWLVPLQAEEFIADKEPLQTVEGKSADEIGQVELSEELAKAGRAVHALEIAKGQDVPSYRQSYFKLISAQASSWSEEPYTLISSAKSLAEEAYTGAQEVFSGFHIISQTSKLSGNNGEVPVILKNDNNQELKLTVKAHGNGSLEVHDKKFKDGVLAGTLAGENYLSIPVRLLDKSIHNYSLTVEVYAGDYLLTSKEIPVEASRTDLIAILVAALIILLLLLFLLRSRLREAGVAEAFDNTKGGLEQLDQVIGEIKEEIERESQVSQDDNPEGPVHEAGLSPHFYDAHSKHVIYAGDPLIQEEEESLEPEAKEPMNPQTTPTTTQDGQDD